MRPLRLLLPLLLWAGIARAGGFTPDSVDVLMREALRIWHVPGAAVAIVRGDSVILERGYGLRAVTNPDSVTPHSLFAIASLTKAFTSTLLGKLVDQGAIHWDDRVTDYLPQFQMSDPYVTHEMRIRDLLCHRSGLKTFAGDLIWYGTNYSEEEVLRRLRFVPLSYGFRSRYGYQNIMVMAAGMIAEKVTGRPWKDLVQDSILTPLGMKETRTSVGLLDAAPDVALPHVERDGDLQVVPYRQVDNIAPAAGLNASVHDLARWIRRWLGGGPATGGVRWLSPATQLEILSLQTPTRISLRGREMVPSRHFSGAALGWFVNDLHGRLVANHGGGMDGMISEICLVPEDNTGFVVLTNCTSSMAPAVYNALLEMLLGDGTADWRSTMRRMRDEELQRAAKSRQAMEAERIKGTHPALPLAAYAGTYRSEMYGDVVVKEQGGKLEVRFVPTASYIADLSHWHYDTFRIDMRDPNLPPGLATFVLNDRGKPAELRIDIPNPDFDFTELHLERVEP